MFDLGESRCATAFSKDNPYGTNELNVCEVQESYPVGGAHAADGQK